MACIYPSVMISDIRKAVATNTPLKKRDIKFPGEFIKQPHIVPSPGHQTVGKITVPIWCSCCGDELTAGLPVIEFGYDAHPGQPNSDPSTDWMHIEKCKHSGAGFDPKEK